MSGGLTDAWRATYIKRFWAKAKRQESGCWEWQGFRQRGYGRLTVDGKPTRAHRFAWTLTNGPVPDGLFVCHRCDNPPCCNPDHLFLGTHADNMADMVAKGRSLKGDRSPTRRHPETRARGARSGAFTHPERVPRGERSGTSLLTEVQVLAIVARLRAGERHRLIAPSFGVTTMTISSIATGRGWRHLTGGAVRPSAHRARTPQPPDRRALAVDVARREGPRRAAEVTGVPRRTILRWLATVTA